MTSADERVCSIALTLCPGIGHIGAKRLIEGMGSAVEVFRRRTEVPQLVPGANAQVVTALDNPSAFSRAEALKMIREHQCGVFNPLLLDRFNSSVEKE